MNDNVVPIKPKTGSIKLTVNPDSLDNVTEGPAICTGCKHEWLASIPVGTFTVECPSCGSFKGIRKTRIEPETVWTCNCGNILFAIAEDGCYCIECGVIANFG